MLGVAGGAAMAPTVAGYEIPEIKPETNLILNDREFGLVWIRPNWEYGQKHVVSKVISDHYEYQYDGTQQLTGKYEEYECSVAGTRVVHDSGLAIPCDTTSRIQIMVDNQFVDVFNRKNLIGNDYIIGGLNTFKTGF